jgi:hypothetical protein
MNKNTMIKLSSLGLAIAILSGCANQLNVPSSTRVKVYENPNSNYTQSKVLVPGEKFSEKSNFVIVDTANSPVMKTVRFVADNGKYVEVDVSIVAKVKDDAESINKVTDNITPSAVDSRAIPFQSVWNAYASNVVEVSLIDFFNKPQNQNINTITRQVLDGYVKNSVANTPIQIQNLSVTRSLITDPRPIYEFKVMEPVKHKPMQNYKK